MRAVRRRLLWAPSSRRDLLDIWHYYAGIASADVADRLLRDIHGAAERARARPLTWRTRDEVMPGLRSVTAHPYVVFYRVENDAVEIVRVLHQRRDIAAAFARDQG